MYINTKMQKYAFAALKLKEGKAICKNTIKNIRMSVISSVIGLYIYKYLPQAKQNILNWLQSHPTRRNRSS